jgi:hypothetical protein
LVAQALAPGPERLRELTLFESALARIFYRELGGDDRAQQVALRTMVAQTRSDAKEEPTLALRREKGAITKAIEARDQPVVPQPLSADDHDPSIPLPAVSAKKSAEPAPLVPIQPVPLPPGAPGPRPAGTSSQGGSFSSSFRSPHVAALAIFWFTIGFITALLCVLGARFAETHWSSDVPDAISTPDAPRIEARPRDAPSQSSHEGSR